MAGIFDAKEGGEGSSLLVRKCGLRRSLISSHLYLQRKIVVL